MSSTKPRETLPTTGEPKRARPILALPSRIGRSRPPDAEPAAPPPPAAPESASPPVAAPEDPPKADSNPEPNPAPAVDGDPDLKTPPDTATPATPPAAEGAPTPPRETITDKNLSDALEVVRKNGSRKSALQSELGISKERAEALLIEMEAKGIIGPTPKRGKKREILVDTWPPEPPFTEMVKTLDARHAFDTARLDELENLPEEPSTPAPEAAPEKSFLRRALERFVSKFRGEAQPEDAKEYAATGTDFVKAIARGTLGVVATYTGVKVLADLPPWFYQKIWTNPAERKRIKDALAAKETELGETTEPSALNQKKARLEEAINASKFLTKEKKAELLGQLHKTIDEYEKKDKSLRSKRNETIAELLDEAIQTRVKNTQVFKEGMNFALMVTGLSAMRGVGYGAVAVYERHQEVVKRLKEESEKGGKPFEKDKVFYKEWIIGGFTQTLHNLIGGKADTWTGKGMNFVKGATNVLRAAGFADLAIAEYMQEGGPSKMIEASLKAWEEKSAVGFLADNIKVPWQRLGHLGEYAKTVVTGSETAPGVTPETPEGSGTTGTGDAAATESAPSVEEIPETQIEAGLVKKDDGIVRLLERQGIPRLSAIQAAKEAGILRSGGDTRLTTEAIGRLSVFAETQPDGGIEIKFFDSETEKVLTLAQAHEAGLTYEHGTVPGEIPTQKEVVSHAAEPDPNANTTTEVHGQDSPDVPNEFLNGTFKIQTDENGNFVDVHYGDGDPLQRINAALAELGAAGHGDSAEANYLQATYKKMHEALYGSTEAQALPDASGNPERSPITEPVASTNMEPLRKFKGEAGKIKFIYDKVTGAVKDAFMPAYTPGRRDIEDALKEWGLTTRAVKDHFFTGTSQTHMDGTIIDRSHPGRYPGVERTGFPIQSPENDYRQFVRNAERLTRQEALLNDMAERGYARTPEYARLKMETEKLETYVTGNMTIQFNIKERRI